MRSLCLAAIVTAFASPAHGQEQPSAAPEPQEQQQPAPPPSAPLPPAPQPQQPSAALPCIRPAPMVDWDQYVGPFQKVVGAVGRRVERKATYTPRQFKPGAVLCVLTFHDKVKLAVEETFDPITLLGVAFGAGIGQAENTDRSYGQGAQGYGKRFGAGMAGVATSQFFKDVLYPTIFSQDPRYYRLGTGSLKKRFFHALEHSVVAYHENGKPMFNFTEWLGTTSAILVSNTYHPDYQRGVVPAAEALGASVGGDMASDVLREFWPEIARRFKLPFRGQNQTASPQPPGEKD